MNNILKTTEYKKFSFIKGNRKLDHLHVKNLMKSISEKNMLAEHPIVVTEKLEILDGQHRFMAAKKRGLDIYYVISESVDQETLLTDIVRIQKSKPWSQYDFLESYINRGLTDYQVLKDFHITYDLTLSTAIELLMINKNGYPLSKLFKEGMFKVNNLANAEILAKRLIEMKPYIEDGIRRDREFINALIKAYQLVKADELLYKIKQCKSMLVQQNSTKAYLQLLENIYNFRRQNIVRFY